MKTPLLALALVAVFAGCATELRSRNGVVLLRQSSDSGRLRYTYSGGGERITLEVDNHQPSKTIRAAGSVVGTTATGTSGILATWLAGGVR